MSVKTEPNASSTHVSVLRILQTLYTILPRASAEQLNMKNRFNEFRKMLHAVNDVQVHLDTNRLSSTMLHSALRTIRDTAFGRKSKLANLKDNVLPLAWRSQTQVERLVVDALDMLACVQYIVELYDVLATTACRESPDEPSASQDEAQDGAYSFWTYMWPLVEVDEAQTGTHKEETETAESKQSCIKKQKRVICRAVHTLLRFLSTEKRAALTLPQDCAADNLYVDLNGLCESMCGDPDNADRRMICSVCRGDMLLDVLTEFYLTRRIDVQSTEWTLVSNLLFYLGRLLLQVSDASSPIQSIQTVKRIRGMLSGTSDPDIERATAYVESCTPQKTLEKTLQSLCTVVDKYVRPVFDKLDASGQRFVMPGGDAKKPLSPTYIVRSYEKNRKYYSNVSKPDGDCKQAKLPSIDHEYVTRCQTDVYFIYGFMSLIDSNQWVPKREVLMNIYAQVLMGHNCTWHELNELFACIKDVTGHRLMRMLPQKITRSFKEYMNSTLSQYGFQFGQ